MSSYCFIRIKRSFKSTQAFDDFIKEKIIPIQGDLTIDGLGISPEDKSQLIENLDVIINSAASVRFDDPLLEAL